MVLVCGEKNDKLEYADTLAEKVVGYRVFSDADGKMNLSLKTVNGGILVASQFTLAADTNSGTRELVSGGRSGPRRSALRALPRKASVARI